MAASSTDLFKKGARKWVGQIGAAGVTDAVVATIPLSSATGLPTDTGVEVVIDRVDSSGTKTPSLEETIVGVVSGSNIVTATRGVEGTAQAHLAGAVVEVVITADMWNDMVDGILVAHDQAGAHKSGSVFTLPQINDTSSDHQYVFSVCELTADRTVALPLLTGNDEIVFKDHTQTLTNKTLTTPVIASIYQDAGKTKLMSLPDTDSDTLVALAAAQVLTNKTIASHLAYADGRYKVATYTYDVSTASGNQTLTGVGFTPTAAVLLGTINNSIVASVGFTTGSVGNAINQNGTAGNWGVPGNPNCIWLVVTAGNGAYASMTFNSDGGVLAWTKSGTPTGTANIIVLWLR